MKVFLICFYTTFLKLQKIMNNKKGGKTNYNGKRRTVEKLTKK